MLRVHAAQTNLEDVFVLSLLACQKIKSRGGAAVALGGGSEVEDSEGWSAVGGEGNPDWPCPTTGCGGHIMAKKRRNFNSCAAVERIAREAAPYSTILHTGTRAPHECRRFRLSPAPMLRRGKYTSVSLVFIKF